MSHRKSDGGWAIVIVVVLGIWAVGYVAVAVAKGLRLIWRKNKGLRT